MCDWMYWPLYPAPTRVKCVFGCGRIVAASVGACSVCLAPRDMECRKVEADGWVTVYPKVPG